MIRYRNKRFKRLQLPEWPQQRGAPFIAAFAMSGIFARRREPLLLHVITRIVISTEGEAEVEKPAGKSEFNQ